MHRLSPIGGTVLLAYFPIYADLSEHHFGSRFSEWLKFRPLSKWLRKALHIKLVRTVPIEDKQVIFGMHPHAILPLGSVVNFTFDEEQFDALFPTLSDRFILGASSCFLVPVFRELLISNRVRDCSRFNAKKWLSNGPTKPSGVGSTICLVPGGAREGLYANPHEDWLDLRRKVGFLRLAVEHSVKVVPCFTFNEVSYVTQVRHDVVPWVVSLMRTLLWQKTVGISLPLATGILPSNVHLTTVVGAPIQLPYHGITPSDAQLEECMDLYCAALQQLYDTHAPLYNSRPRKLNIT